MKRCSTCGQAKPLSDFHRNRARDDGYAGLCKECQTAKKLQGRVNARTAAHALFGGKCQRCGNDDWRVLELDHVNGGGNADRIAGKISNHYSRAYINHVGTHRDEFQLLCANCHRIKTWEDRDRARGVALPEPLTRAEVAAQQSATQSAKMRRYWARLTPEERTARSRRAAATVRANGGQRRAVKTHCKHGHEFTPENTHIDPKGKRICRACKREWNRRAKAAESPKPKG